MKKSIILFSVFILFFSCKNEEKKQTAIVNSNPYIFILGTAQDAGYPQAGCEKECCKRVYENAENGRFVVSFALVDPISKENWIFDATPDFPKQLKLLSNHLQKRGNLPNGILLTHAHIGHYTGLMHLGREAMGTNMLPVYTMPKLKRFLENNGPWSQLVALKNIDLKPLKKDSTIFLNERISVKPMLVPHRDEYSETVGYLINANSKKILLIPDIDKWHLWNENIVDYIKNVDVALLDATFFKDVEIKGRAMSEIPHPFVEESMELFKNLSKEDKEKVHFIHFNHTNPLLIDGSEAQIKVIENGFNLAKQGRIINLE